MQEIHLQRLLQQQQPFTLKLFQVQAPVYKLLLQVVMGVVEGNGWFLGFHVFTHYVKVSFFRGALLRPTPKGGTGKDARWVDIREDDFDEAQMASWIKQVAVLPGWLS